MLQKLFNSDNRAQVGIGTLIVFIAMVLVAAVAAGVLVNTAGLLQGQSETTGQDAQSEISNNIDVVTKAGTVSSDNVQSVELVVKKSPGADPIDLESATIQYSSGSASETLLYDSAGVSATAFNTTSVQGSSATVLSETSDRISVEIDANAVDGPGLAEDESATLRVVDQSGATTTVELNAPQEFAGDTNVDL